MLTDHHQLLLLIENLYQLRNQSVFRLLMLRQFCDRDRNFYRIPDEHRPDKPKPVIPVRHSRFIDLTGRHANGYAEDKSAMRNPFFKRLCLTPFFIHMMREKISGLTGMKDDIRLRDSAAGSVPLVVDSKIFKM